jgi:enoyl-CoA hydratase/3-hydroxyacyl-CoA dehydrogenase
MASAPAPSSSLVAFEIEGGVATITINRPDVLNNINFVVLHQLQQAFDRAIADPAVHGIVLAGAGKVFIVGADIEFFIRNMPGDIPRIVKFTEAGHRLFNTIDASPKPVVARVQGAALGGGTETALACDYVIAAPGGSFGFPETGLGIYPGFGGTQRAPRKLGIGLAKWMIFTGKTLSAAESWKIGLVDEVVPPNQVDAVCRAVALGQHNFAPRPARTPDHSVIEEFFARSRAADLRAGTADTRGQAAAARAMKLVAGKAPIALRLAETMIDRGMQVSLAEGLQQEIDHVTEIFSTADALAGLQFRSGKQLGSPAFEGR